MCIRDRHVADGPACNVGGHVRNTWHAPRAVELENPEHDDRPITRLRDQVDVRFRRSEELYSSATFPNLREYKGAADDDKIGNAISYVIIPAADDKGATTATRVVLAGTGASYRYEIVPGTTVSRLWLMLETAPNTCCVGVGYSDIRQFINRGIMKGRDTMHAHLCPVEEALKNDFRAAGPHDDLIVVLDLRRMMQDGYRFSLREVPTPWFIVECVHDGLNWKTDYVLALASKANFAIICANLNAILVLVGIPFSGYVSVHFAEQ